MLAVFPALYSASLSLSPRSRPLCCSSSILTGDLSFLLYICVCFVSVISTRMLYFLDPTYKRCHEAFVFFWLTSSSIIPSQSMHVAANGKVSVFLCLSSIPVCVCVCVVYRIFFIHALVNGCLDCCHSVAVVTLLWILGCMYLFGLLCFYGYIPSSGISRAYGISVFSFGKETKVLGSFPQWLK